MKPVNSGSLSIPASAPEPDAAWPVGNSETPRSPHSSDNILREIAQAISTASGEEFFRRLAEALCQTLEADFAFIGRLDADDPKRIHVMAGCGRGGVGPKLS